MKITRFLIAFALQLLNSCISLNLDDLFYIISVLLCVDILFNVTDAEIDAVCGIGMDVSVNIMLIRLSRQDKMKT